jgi:hypothetical protein
VYRSGDQLIGGGHPVELCKRVNPFLLFLVMRERQGVDRGLANLVLESLRQEELPRNRWAFKVQSRRCVLEPAEVVAANAEFR